MLVALGEITASGPPGARLAIGIIVSAHAESYGPTTPTSRSAFANAFAFAWHVPGSDTPDWGVESSQDW